MKKVLTLLLFLMVCGSSVRADDGGKAWLEKFYQKGVECFFDESYLKPHLTKKAELFLRDSYPYDGEGMATWLFYQEGGWDIGDFKEFKVDEMKDNTYRVTFHAKFNDDTYEYTVVFGLVRVANAWKIDTMKPGKGVLKSCNPGIQNGSRWNVGSLDYTAKVNADNSITFSAMAEGEELSFRLTPNADKEKEYVMGDAPDADGFNPFSSATRAKLIDEDSWKLLCLYDQKGLLLNVLNGKAQKEGLDEALNKWDVQLAGRYIDKYGDTLQISFGTIYEKGVARAEYKHLPFNGQVTGVIGIRGLSNLEGMWEAAVTLDGLTLYEVEEDEYGMFKRKGGKETLRWARKDFPRFNYTWLILLNDNQFRRLKKSTLRIMRNEILARNGYRFQSKDLQDYFSQWTWYHPFDSNDDVKPGFIDTLNIQLIQAEEAKADEDRNVTEE